MMAWKGLVATALSLTACDRGSDVSGARPLADPEGRAAPLESTPPSSDGPKIKARTASGKTEVRTPRWSESVEVLAESLLSDTSRAEVKKAPVPALVVNEPKWLAATVVTTGPHWYAASFRDGGLTVSIHGTRLAHLHDDIPPAEGRSSVRGRPAFVTENEAIVSAAWVEDGVAYSLDLECFDRDDRRCRDEAYVLELGGRLVFVGGQGAKR